MTANEIARQRTQANVAADIRRVSVGSQRITVEVALANHDYFFSQGRYSEAKGWWRIVHEFITGER